jgi:hypothetical protein
MRIGIGTELSRRASREDGFAMMITLGVLLVTGLLLAATMTTNLGEISATRTDTTQKLAYYAALAGIQEYEYKLQVEPSYWQKCEGPKGKIPTKSVTEQQVESYEVEVLPATSWEESQGASAKCEASNPFQSVIESGGAIANTFRVLAKGHAGVGSNEETRELVATFKVTGFLDFIYYTNFETLDPVTYTEGPKCAGKYYSTWFTKEKLKCQPIQFVTGDKVDGPMHTNDSAEINGGAIFGREGQKPADKVEIYGGAHPEDEGYKCTETAKPKFYTSSKCYEKGELLIPPENDTSLEAYVEEANKFEGQTWLELNGTTNTIKVVNYKTGEPVETAKLAWPKNGLLYVKGMGCSSWDPFGTDYPAELTATRTCGTVYVKGTYSKSLTIAGSNNVVITGNLTPTSVKTLGEAPSGTATLGLIASEFVRVYHPVSTNYASTGTCASGGTYNSSTKECVVQNEQGACNAANLEKEADPVKIGTMTEPWIYAAILSTAHSFIVDNYDCGAKLKEVNVYGAIAQDYRGPVGTSGSPGTGYIKDYKYDGRLATDEPPYFLAPLKAGWKVTRISAVGPA